MEKSIVDWYRSTDTQTLTSKAKQVCTAVHGPAVLLRGLIEFSNYCRRNCLYCGIRRSNTRVQRYRLSDQQIKTAVREGFARGLRTFVLQGGEDPGFGDERLMRLIGWIKEHTGGQAAVTLSLGTLSRQRYTQLYRAGADRYLIRFETSDPQLHRYLRDGSSLEQRLAAIRDIQDIGYMTGTGYMVGLPGENEDIRIENALLAYRLQADMVGIGPFIPHPATPLREAPAQPLELTLRATALARLLLPKAHIPATTAAGSLESDGREQALEAGANVLMPNLTPTDQKKDYLLYPGKICLEESGIHCIGCLAARVQPLGRELSFDIGGAL